MDRPTLEGVDGDKCSLIVGFPIYELRLNYIEIELILDGRGKKKIDKRFSDLNLNILILSRVHTSLPLIFILFDDIFNNSIFENLAVQIAFCIPLLQTFFYLQLFTRAAE